MDKKLDYNKKCIMQKENQKVIKQIKDFKIILKDFELMVKNPKFLHNGRDIQNFSLRPREAWANWLICVVLRKICGEDITFSEDEKSDGIIIDKKTGGMVATEHVCAMDYPFNKLPKGEERIIDAINHKIKRGIDYAKGKILVVFFDGAGVFYRNKIRESIKGRHNFVSVFCVGLLTSGDEGYSYAVTEFRESFGDTSMTFKVDINADFTDWQVEQVKQ